MSKAPLDDMNTVVPIVKFDDAVITGDVADLSVLPKHGLRCLQGDTRVFLRMSCSHRRSNMKSGGACGGCFARLWTVLCAMGMESQEEHVKALFAELVRQLEAEDASSRLRGDNRAGVSYVDQIGFQYHRSFRNGAL